MYIVNVCIRLEKANVHQCAMFLNYCTIYLNLVVPICISKNLMYYGNPPYLYCKLWISASSRQKQSYDLCGSLCYWQAIAPFLIAIYGISVFAQSYLLLYMYSSSNFHSLQIQEKGATSNQVRAPLLRALQPTKHRSRSFQPDLRRTGQDLDVVVFKLNKWRPSILSHIFFLFHYLEKKWMDIYVLRFTKLMCHGIL